MNEANWLKQIDGTVTGDGIWRELPVPLREAHLNSTGATLTTTLTTNPGFDKVDTNVTVLAWAADKVVAAGIGFDVPLDYDETNDELSVWLLAKMGGTTDTPTIGAAAYTQSAPTTDLAPDATAALSDSYAWVQVDLDSNSLLANDHVHVVLTPAAHSTDAIYVAAIKVRYRGDIVAYDYTERSCGDPA